MTIAARACATQHGGDRDRHRHHPRAHTERLRSAPMIERSDFGRTGHRSSRVIFGAAALGSMRQEKADTLLDVLFEFGVNHLDTAAGYGDSELRLAPWLATHRGS